VALEESMSESLLISSQIEEKEEVEESKEEEEEGPASPTNTPESPESPNEDTNTLAAATNTQKTDGDGASNASSVASPKVVLTYPNSSVLNICRLRMYTIPSNTNHQLKGNRA
jgi:outer membrane biosynthesis protein TonB